MSQAPKLWSSGWVLSWEGLFEMTLADVSTTWMEVIFRVKLWNVSRLIPSTDVPQFTSSWLWRWFPLRLSKRQSVSPQTVLLRTTITRMIKIYVVIKVFTSWLMLISALRLQMLWNKTRQLNAHFVTDHIIFPMLVSTSMAKTVSNLRGSRRNRIRWNCLKSYSMATKS